MGPFHRLLETQQEQRPGVVSDAEVSTPFGDDSRHDRHGIFGLAPGLHGERPGRHPWSLQLGNYQHRLGGGQDQHGQSL